MKNLNFLLDRNIWHVKLRKHIHSMGFGCNLVMSNEKDIEIARKSQFGGFIVITRDRNFIDDKDIKRRCYGILYISQGCEYVATAFDRAIEHPISACQVIAINKNCTAKCL